ncbi:MAG TPA: hypothetical protein VJR05_03375 [Acidimicrobiia bacterium]|nr:hypothetical protein [Acidimicrobiia bacterium]
MRMHLGTLFAGLVYLTIGAAFTFEALGWWSFQWSDFRLLAPLSLVAIGLAVVVGAIGRRHPVA